MVHVSARAKDFSLFHNIRIESGAHPDSSIMDNEGSFPGIKLPGSETQHSSLPFKNAWRYTSTCLRSMMVHESQRNLYLFNLVT
jgi:hypothetical protein